MLATEAYKGVISYGEIEKASCKSAFFIFLPIVFHFSYIQASADCNQCHGKIFQKNRVIRKKKLIKLPFYLKVIFGLITLCFAVYMLLQYISIFVSAVSSNSGGHFHWTMEFFQSFSLTKIPSIGKKYCTIH